MSAVVNVPAAGSDGGGDMDADIAGSFSTQDSALKMAHLDEPAEQEIASTLEQAEGMGTDGLAVDVPTTTTSTTSTTTTQDEAVVITPQGGGTMTPVARRGKDVTRFEHEDVHDPNWARHKKHVFVLSNAGKPIFTRYGDGNKLSDFFGIVQAMIEFVNESNDSIRYIVAGRHKFVFLIKGPLYLVCVTRSGEPERLLRLQLEYLHAQILSILTNASTKAIASKSSFDLRDLLGGTEKVLHSVVERCGRDPSFLLDSVQCLKLPSATRTAIGSILANAQVPDLLYSLLICGHQLVSLVRPKKIFLHPADLLIVLNFVNSSASLRSSESWVPVCLPQLSDSGFMYAYIAFLDDAKEIGLVLLTTKPDRFLELQRSRHVIEQQLQEQGCVGVIERARAAQYRVADVGIPQLRHFLFRNDAICQYSSPVLPPPYHTRKGEKRFFLRYQTVFARMYASTSKPHRVYFHTTDNETILAWTTPTFFMVAAISAMTSKRTAVEVGNQLLRWIKKEESNLFVLNSPTW